MKQTRKNKKNKTKYNMQSNIPDLKLLLVRNILRTIQPNITKNIYDNVQLIKNLPGILPEFKIYIFQEYLLDKTNTFKMNNFIEYIFRLVSKCCDNDPFLLNTLKAMFEVIPSNELKRILTLQSGYGMFQWPNGSFSKQNQNQQGFLHMIVGYHTQCLFKFEIVKLLLKYGANPFQKNKYGLTPLQLEEKTWVPYGYRGPRGDPRVKISLRNAMKLDVSQELLNELQSQYQVENLNQKLDKVDFNDLKPPSPKRRKKSFKMSSMSKMSSKPKTMSIFQEHNNLIEIINKNKLDKEISKGNCVLIFYMKTCPYCIKLREVIFQLCENNIKVVIMEQKRLDDNIKSSYQIDGYPTIYIVKPDGTKELFTGKRDYENISQNLSSN